MNSILNIFGELSAEDVAFITGEEAFQYVEDRVDFENSRVDFSKEFTLTDKKLSKIQQNLLEFNFHFRKPASQLLKSPIFD